MSNKAIVFYTGELLEVQENSLREAHGVENIIFVPIERVNDLETKILENTERPFVVYNYLTNPELVLALCDKLLSFTSETGYESEYFIWVDGTELNSIQAHYNKPGEPHVDVSGIPMPDNIKAVKERVEKFKEMHSHTDIRTSMKDFDPNEPRPDPYLSYGEAIEMCKKGIDVACVNWRADEFLTVNSGAMVHADNFWSPGNKRMAMAKADKQLAVFPHFLRTSPFGTVPYVPDFNDMFSEWVVSADRVKVKRVTIRSEEGFLKLTLNYGLDTFATSEFELAPFWIVYDVLADMAPLVTVIGDNKVSNLPAIVGAMKNAHDQRQRYVSQTFTLDENGLIEDRDNYSPYVQHHVIDQLGVTIERIKEGAYKHVVVDIDSFKTDFRLEKIKEALQGANVNWCSVSIKEQVYGIFE